MDVIRKAVSGELSVADALKYLPDPPRLAPTINRVIDRALHPLAERDKVFYLVDSLLHTGVEVADTLVLSFVKTLRYNVPKLVEGVVGRG